MTTGAVILGAGFSRRYGADKRLQPLLGQTVAECTVEKYAAAFKHIRVVVRPDDTHLADTLARFNIDIIVSPDTHLGMGHSLAAGFAELTWDWAFVGLLDMPYVQTATLQHLIQVADASGAKQILRPRLPGAPPTGGQTGHPIGWPKAYFEEIRGCRGDTGARALLQRYAQQVKNIEVDDPGIVHDIDRPEDLRPR